MLKNGELIIYAKKIKTRLNEFDTVCDSNGVEIAILVDPCLRSLRKTKYEELRLLKKKKITFRSHIVLPILIFKVQISYGTHEKCDSEQENCFV